MADVGAHVVRAELVLGADCDPRAVGAAVTTALCGEWEHDGPCRWPHNNAIDADASPATFRTLFVATDADAPTVRARIEAALRGSSSWRASDVRRERIGAGDRALARRLLDGPRLPSD